MEKKEIDDVVCEIMYQDGPDRHVDGHEYITDFIVAEKENRAEEWLQEYMKGKDAHFH